MPDGVQCAHFKGNRKKYFLLLYLYIIAVIIMTVLRFMLMRPFLIFCFFCVHSVSEAWAFSTSDTPPPVEKVFSLSTTQPNSTTLRLRWNIQEGYYLFKKSIRVNSDPQHPHGEPKLQYPAPSKATALAHKTTRAVYRGKIEVIAQFCTTRPVPPSVTIEYQGCAASGYCYPPQQQKIVLQR